MLLLSGCSDNGKVTDVTLSETSQELLTDEEFSLEPHIEPSGLKNVSLEWTSSDVSIASVQDGVVKALSPGFAEITVTTGNGCTATCFIEVRDPVLPEWLELSKDEFSLMVDDSFALDVTIYPENVDDTSVVWETSNENVLSVSQNGVITAKAEGTAVITVTSSNGLSASATVTVSDLTSESLDSLLMQQPLYVSSTDYIEEGTYLFQFNDMLRATIVNNGEDTIKNAVIAFVAWDKNNLPIRLEGDFWIGEGVYCLEATYSDVNLIPGETYGEDSGIELGRDVKGIVTTKACVVSYETFDGKSWSNPYYTDFVALYSDKIFCNNVFLS